MHNPEAVTKPGHAARGLALALVAIAVLLSASSRAASYILSWHPSTSPHVVGYNVYYGGATQTYTNMVAGNDAAKVTLSSLLPGAQYFFAVTAVDNAGVESVFSNEISWQVPGEPAVTPPRLVQAHFSYTANHGRITITGYTGPGGAVALPSAINGLVVTSIGANALDDCIGLASVTIPGSVTSIGDDAFYGCTSLTSVTIPDSVTSIGEGAFSWCLALAKVAIPSSVTNLGRNAFGSCPSLTAITVDPLNSFYSSSVDGVLLNKGQTKLLQYPAGKGRSYTIPGSVTSIGDDAFYGCTRLASVTIPDSVTNLGQYAFASCSSLTAITVDPLNSFYSSSVDGVLLNKSQTEVLQYPAGERGWYTIPDGVTSVGDDAFYGSGLAGVTIPDSVTNLGSGAFRNCIGLTDVTIGNNHLSLGSGAFEFCTGLTNITMGDGVVSVGNAAFGFCTRLTGVYLEGDAPAPSAAAFYGDKHTTVHYLPWTTGWGPSFAGWPAMPWNPASGTYNGLFADDSGSLSPQNCGAFTLMVTVKGAFSGSLQMGGMRYALSGQFDPNGAAGSTIARRNLSALTVSLQLDLTNGTDRVTGTVSDGAWAAALAGDRAIYDGRTTVAPEAGSYTLILAGAYESTNEPAGDSYGTLAVGENGAISFAGTLADGTKVAQSVPVSKNRQWPLYAPLYGGQGVLWGWLSFTNASDLGSPVAWVKLPANTQHYPAGFSLAVQAVGTRYFPSGTGTNVLGLTTGTNLTLTLEGGGLMQGLTNRFTLAANNRVTPVSGPKLSLTFTPSTGGFAGSVVNPATSRPISFGGVWLQGRAFGSGFFLGAGGSGEVRLEP